jgi:hypothetical protein
VDAGLPLAAATSVEAPKFGGKNWRENGVYNSSTVCVSSFSRDFPVPLGREQLALDRVVSQPQDVQLEHDECKKQLQQKRAD